MLPYSFSATESRPLATRGGTANRTPALGRLGAGANTGSASSRSPIAARTRSVDRSSGSASRLFSALLGRGRVLLGEGCCATEDEVPLDLSADTVALSVCKSASGSNGRWGSGDGVQPSRRRLLRTCFSSSPSRPPIQRLLLPLALRRRMIRSRLWASLYAEELPEGRPFGRASAASPSDSRCLWYRRRVRME